MKRILYFAAIVALLAGCSKSSQSDTPLRDTPISVNVLLPEILTRAGFDSANLPTLFYLSIDQKGTNYDYTNVVMKFEEGAWVAYESAEETAAKQLLWEGSTGNVTVTAATFSLSYSSAAPSYELSALADQSTDANVKASDHLCYYSTGVKPSKEGISIPFCHIMSKLKIKLTLGTEYEDATDNPISSVAVFGSKIKGTYTPIIQSSISSQSNSGSFSPQPNPITIVKWGSQSENSIIKTLPLSYSSLTATYEAILIPQTIAANNFVVEILIGDKTYEWKSTAEVELEEGKEYTLELTAGKDKVSGSSFTASTWGSGTGISSATE